MDTIGDAPAVAVRPRRIRRRSIANLLRMGHCAPTVMKTLLDELHEDAPWLVRLVAGLPGGIGNSRNECGGITAPLVLLGLRHGRDPTIAGVPAVVCKGHALLQDFRACHGSTSCRDILGDARIPLRCIGVVRCAPERCLAVESQDCSGAISGERLEAYARLEQHFGERRFHCAHEVLRYTFGPTGVDQTLLDATEAFVGGTVLAGLTCSAMAAGVMLIGTEFGQIEDSPLRVLRMIGKMAVGGDALAEHVNGFNRAMNVGHELARWFKSEFGSTQCRDITGCDFATVGGVQRYVERDCVGRCCVIARDVAVRVASLTRNQGANTGAEPR